MSQLNNTIPLSGSLGVFISSLSRVIKTQSGKCVTIWYLLNNIPCAPQSPQSGVWHKHWHVSDMSHELCSNIWANSNNINRKKLQDTSNMVSSPRERYAACNVFKILCPVVSIISPQNKIIPFSKIFAVSLNCLENKDFDSAVVCATWRSLMGLCIRWTHTNTCTRDDGCTHTNRVTGRDRCRRVISCL